MAGSYYAATPIGAGLGNIAEAISGLPARREQAALLAQRRDLVQSQILTDAAHRGHYEEQTAGLRQAREGREGMARVFEESGTTGTGGPDADPQPSAAPIPSPSNPPSITTAFMADRMPGDPISVAPAAPVAPTAPPVPAAPNVANAVVGPNRIGWTPQQNARYYAAAVRANEDKAGDYVRGYAGGNMAATEKNPDRALSYTQAGAGQNWNTSVSGAGEKLAEEQRNHEQQSADRQRGQNIASADRRRGQDMTDARGRDRASQKGGKGAPQLKRADLVFIDKKLAEYATGKGKSLSPESATAMRQRVMDLYDEGETMQDAIDIANDEAYQTTPEHDEPGKVFGNAWPNKVPAKTEFVKPTVRERAPGGGKPGTAPAPAPAPAKASTSVEEWKAKARAKGWDEKRINETLKAKGY